MSVYIITYITVLRASIKAQSFEALWGWGEQSRRIPNPRNKANASLRPNLDPASYQTHPQESPASRRIGMWTSGTRRLLKLTGAPLHPLVGVRTAFREYKGCLMDVSTTVSSCVEDYVRQEGLEVQWILETHAHADHLSAAPYIQEKLLGYWCLICSLTSQSSRIIRACNAT